MDEEDYSWVRRTRFSHSVVRSNSGREQFGAFVEQFNRGAARRQRGPDSGFMLHGLNLEPRTRLSATSSVNSSVPKPPETRPSSSSNSVPKTTGSSNVQPPETKPSSSSSNSKQEHQEKRGNHHRLQEGSTKQDNRAENEKATTPGPQFSFHPDEQTLMLQRAYSSPVPFPSKKKMPDADAATRSSSLKVAGEGTKPKMKQRARSPPPRRDVPELFREAKSSSKRFSTPPPRRKPSSPPAPSRSPPPAFALVKAHGKPKHKKDSFDNGRAKVAALEVLEKWTVDRSQLLIGHRFASGAHSRLFHGIYKEQPVAVKFIRQPEDEEDAELAAQLEKQFNTEVTTLSRLHHPNVIKLIGACSSPPVFCVITEFLSGGSLRAFLHKQEHKSLPLEKIISIGLDIARGIGYIHSQRVVHRDVKPDNIIFDSEFCAKIVDFGISCEEAECDPLANDTGTFRWMAPEMMKHKPYGRKVDVYSFGLILWEMFTGSVPYEDLNPFQAAFAVFDKNERPVIPSSCPAALRLLIEQCWTSQPDKRPEFWQIVQILEKFKVVLSRDGTLDNMPCSNLQGTHDHKNWLAHWVQKLKHTHHDLSGPPPPKLL
ncbi:serine/threonine/tyrosine-protein kinase HT1-like [Oryza brachyantha]|uniref:Protein kinase domain-containing protein n=1 Tax=Oryza brachyantha TaxID=4533 RepID=J3L404_ORYBR|nr:serine/threonine/tyrosine-protein kinase HT1-like [Oryza brachyantha]